MRAYSSGLRVTAGGRSKSPLVVMLVTAVVLVSVADLAAPHYVPLGTAGLVPVLAACLVLDLRWSLIVLGLAIAMRLTVAALGDTSVGLAAVEIASYIAPVTLVLAIKRSGDFVSGRPLFDDVALVAPRPVLSPTLVESSALTEREHQVLVMAIHGLTSAQIGERLFIGRRTVETHLGRAYSKLGVRTKRELIAGVFDDTSRTATRGPTTARPQNP